MVKSAFHFSLEEARNFLLIVAVTAAAFSAFYGEMALSGVPFFFGVSALIVLTREIAIRMIAQWMDAYTDLKISIQGSTTTIVGAIIAVVSGLPFLLLFPLYSTLSAKSYENWGKEIDAVWTMRELWFYGVGIFSLVIGWAVFYSYGFMRVAEMYILFAFFQALPFDYPMIPTDELDGAFVLRWSGFYWLLFMGVIIIAMTVTLT